MLLVSIKRHKIEGKYREVGETYEVKDKHVRFLTAAKWAKKAEPPASRAPASTEPKDSPRRYQRKEMLPEV